MTQSLPCLVRSQPLRLVDVFSGAGGMTQGFLQVREATFRPIWAVDAEPTAVQSYSANFGAHAVIADVAAIVAEQPSIVPRADVVIGGPPCQGFSLLNRNRHDDERRELWQPFMRVVELAEADVFVMENVAQILKTDEHDRVLEHAARLGFRCSSAKLCAADYGVPQVRHRAFIVGCRFADPGPFFPPAPTHRRPTTAQQPALQFESEMPVWKTVRDAISELPAPVGTEIRAEPPPLDLHFGRNPTHLSKTRYALIPEGGNRFDLLRQAPELTPRCWHRPESDSTDLFGRMWWDRPCNTIRVEFYKPEKGRYLHPAQNRPITHREAARLQSFPDSFAFRGSKVEIARQIGNAVPPLLAQAVATSVAAMFVDHRVASAGASAGVDCATALA